MRRSFADILNGSKVDIAAEYHSLHLLVYERYGFYGDMRDNFELMPFSGTAYNLQDFNNRNGFHFDEQDSSDDLDELLLFCEYVYNFAYVLTTSFQCSSSSCSSPIGIIEHLMALADKLGYRFVECEKLWVLVPSNEKIEAAAEVMPEALGSDLFCYDYRCYSGDLDSKRKILVSLATSLEPYRAKLSCIAKNFTSDYFYFVNSLNIRHNNVDALDPGKYKELVAKMPDDELEKWYDTVRYMSAAAFLLLDYADRAEAVQELKRG